MHDYVKGLFPKRGPPLRSPEPGRSPTEREVPAPRDDDADLAARLEYLKQLWPPTDMHDAAAWDRYWTYNLQAGFGAAFCDIFCKDAEMFAALREDRLRTVLCVGSGISLEPQRLVAAGFDVTALDLSPLVMDLVGRYCAMHPPSPRLVVGDLTDPAVCSGPYDVIIERRTLQNFSEEERPAAMQAVANRLAPRGIFVSHCHDGHTRPPEVPKHWTRPWFEENHWEVWWARRGKLRERAAWLVLSTG